MYLTPSFMPFYTYSKKLVFGWVLMLFVSVPILAQQGGGCNTSTFFRHFSVAGQKVRIGDMQTFPDGNFLLTGSTILPNGEEEGLLCRMTNQGLLIGQNQFRVNNKPAAIHSVKVMNSGRIIIAGIVTDIPSKIFIGILNNNLSTDWIKTFNMPSVPVKVVADYYHYTGNLTFAAQLNNNNIVYSALNATSVLWIRQASPVGLNELVGIGHTFTDEIGMLVNCTRAGLKVAEHIKIAPATGLTLSAHVLGNGVDEYNYGKVGWYGNRVMFCGVTKTSLGQYKLVRDLVFNTQQTETTHEYVIPGVTNLTVTSALDNAGDVIGFCFPQQGRFVFIKNFSDNQTYVEFTKQYTVPVGTSIRSVARSFIDGGFLFAFNTADSSEFLLLKTDSIGTLPGCGYQSISNTFTEIGARPNTISSATSAAITTASGNGIISLTGSSIVNTADCYQVYCPPAPPEDTCSSTYVKVLRSNSHIDYSLNYLMKNNRHVALTQRVDRIWLEDSAQYGIKRYDEAGRFIDGVTVLHNNIANPLWSKRIDDQHIMLVHGSAVDNQRAFTFTLINDDMQILWSKTAKAFAGYNYEATGGVQDMTRDAEGNYYFVANNLGFMETRKILVYKMNAVGDPVWLKIWDVPGGIFLRTAITTTNSSVVVVAEGSPRNASVRLDKVTGQLLNAYTFILNGGGSSYTRFLQFDNDRIFYSASDDSKFVMGLLDTTGKPFRMKIIDRQASGRGNGDIKDGNFYAIYSYYNGTSYKNTIFKTDSALNILFSNDYNTGSYSFSGPPKLSVAGNIYAGGWHSYGTVNHEYYIDQLIYKFNPAGLLGNCPAESTSPVVLDLAIDVQPASSNPFVNSFTIVPTVPVTFIPDTLGHHISELLCYTPATCNSLSLTGTDIICQLNQPYTYHANRNPGCNAIASWIYDTAFAVLLNTTDSTATFSYKKVGNTWLKTKILTDCGFYTDSMLIQIQNSPQFFSLGADTLMCPGSIIILHAGPGFNSYLWQDGSTDSAYTVTQPGIYHVQVGNLCGDQYRDTIVVSLANIPALDIGLNTAVCYADTLFINASPGFAGYSWQPATVVNGTGQQVYVVPVQNETITVIATTTDGCKAYDTLYITSKSATPVSLGNDTSFCNGNAIILSAGPGYTQYNWSTGATSSSITVNQAGTYWVKALDVNGCYAKDTMLVLQVYANPKPSLGADFSICFNEQKILDAGNYCSYLWNNGSTGRYFVVTSPGLYWVNVIDSRNCNGSDSVLMNGILPLPGDFLKSEDSICNYGKLTITSLLNYNLYIWSTGASTQSIIVSNPGQYILTVNDNNGCKGSDTIKVVSKDCTRAVYIPNVFTPNGDNLNDVFRVKVYGNLASFKLEVYNRYGETVFLTTDPFKGWNGIYKDVKQPSSAFTWRCVYLFEGQIPTEEKGTVLLIR